MTMLVRPYTDADADGWDQFCEQSLQATLLHTRRFLSYHGERFTDQSLIITNEEGKWLGLFPAALQPGDARAVASHPGSTYGGIVHQGQLRGELMLAALTAICRHYRDAGLQWLRYKVVPSFYHKQPAQDDIYALFRLDARRYRCDLSSTIDLARRTPPGERRRRSLKKAQKGGIEVSPEKTLLPALWQILEDNLARKHGARPVHDLAEITLLAERFPQQILLACALQAGAAVAGVVLFVSDTCYHTQYIAASEAGYQTCALDAVFEAIIFDARAAGKRWLDFGICNEQNGQILNEGLYRFKTEFGGGGTVHEFYEISLD